VVARKNEEATNKLVGNSPSPFLLQQTNEVTVGKKMKNRDASHDLGQAGPIIAARKEADLVVTAGSAGQEHPVRVECGGSQRRGLVALEKARVGLYARDFVSVKVKDLDEVCRCATVKEPVSEELDVVES
jgi:hypothetical protein